MTGGGERVQGGPRALLDPKEASPFKSPLKAIGFQRSSCQERPGQHAPRTVARQRPHCKPGLSRCVSKGHGLRGPQTGSPAPRPLANRNMQ